MDEMVVNGKTFSGDSAFSGVAGQKNGQTLVDIDTGTSLAIMPSGYVEAIYGGVPGAVLDPSSGLYVVPCETVIEVSFVFGYVLPTSRTEYHFSLTWWNQLHRGNEYPVHPIDTVIATLDNNGEIVCTSSFSAGNVASDGNDITLGDTFLRNVYQLYDYGSFVGASGTPIIQLLSVRLSSS